MNLLLFIETDTKKVYFDTILFYVREVNLVIYSHIILDDQVHSSWLLVGLS